MYIKNINALTKAVETFRDRFHDAQEGARENSQATLEAILMNIDNIESEIENLKINSEGLAGKILTWFKDHTKENPDLNDAVSIKANENGFTLTLCLGTALNLNLGEDEDFNQEDYQEHMGKFQNCINEDHCLIADRVEREDKFNYNKWVNMAHYEPLLTPAHIDYDFGYVYLSFFATKGLFKKPEVGQEILTEVLTALWRHCEHLRHTNE